MTKHEEFCEKVRDLAKVHQKGGTYELRWFGLFLDRVQTCYSTGESLPPAHFQLEKLMTQAFREAPVETRLRIGTGLKVLAEYFEARALETFALQDRRTRDAAAFDERAIFKYQALPKDLQWL